MSTDKYILKDGEPVPCADLIEWARWFEAADRKVARNEIGEVVVSTVFLGLDHSFSGDTPLLYETLVFGGPLDQEMNRYATLQQAVDGHDSMVERVLDSVPVNRMHSP